MSELVEPAAPRDVRPRHLVLGLAGAVAVGALVITGIGRLAGFSDVRSAIEGGDFRWLAACVVAELAVFAGYSGAWHHAVRSEGGPHVPRVLALRVVLAGFAATQVFAFGGAGGLAVMFWALRKVGLGRERAAVRLIGLNTAVYLVFAVIGWVAAWGALLRADAPLGLTLPWLVVVPLAVLAGRWFTEPGRVERRVDTIRGATWWSRGLAVGVGAAWWVRKMAARGGCRALFGWIALYWLADLAALWAALRAFGSGPPLAVVGIAFVTGKLVQSLPIPLIATGGVDAATTFLLHALGVPLEVALVAVVAYRVFAFWLPVIPGTVAAMLLPRTGRALSSLG